MMRTMINSMPVSIDFFWGEEGGGIVLNLLQLGKMTF